MSRIYTPTRSPEDWRPFLDNPETQWRPGDPTRALAHCWEEADGFPEDVRRALDHSGYSDLLNLDQLLAIPEHQINLPGGAFPSQDDLFVLARGDEGLTAIVVKGMVSQHPGPTVREWITESTSGKHDRLDYLCDLLEIDQAELRNVRCHLVHRAASALIQAERFHARAALMLVHSFRPSDECLEDYRNLLGVFGKSGEADSITRIGTRAGIPLYVGWVTGEDKYLQV